MQERRGQFLATALGFVFALVLLVGGAAIAAMDQWSNDPGINHVRACIPVAGSTIPLTITASSAGSAQLDAETTHSLICDTTVCWDTGDLSAPTVACASGTNDYLPADGLIYFSTGQGDVSRYLSAIQETASGTCYIRKCR